MSIECDLKFTTSEIMAVLLSGDCKYFGAPSFMDVKGRLGIEEEVEDDWKGSNGKIRDIAKQYGSVCHICLCNKNYVETFASLKP